MPAENRAYLFQKGFNAVWNRIENCKFIPAPYDNEINTGYLFVTKRNWTQEMYDVGDDLVGLGRFSSTNKTEKLAASVNNLYAFDDTTITNEWSITIDVINKIWGLPAGDLEDSGTATSGSSTTLVDTGQSWTTNEFAGMYVWLYSWSWIGDMQLITSNTSDTLTVAGWTDWFTPSSGTGYKIFPYLSDETVIMSDNSNTYFYSGSSIESAGITPFNQALEWDWRMWYVRRDKASIINYSYVGQALAIESFLDTGFGNITGLTVFGEYLIVGKPDKILAVKKDQVADGAGGAITVYSISTIVSTVWLVGQWAMGEYQNSLYFMGNDIDLYSVDIIAQNDGTIKGNIKTQWDPLRGYLDRLGTEVRYKFYTYKGDLHINASNVTETYEYIYSLENQWWLVDYYQYDTTALQVIDSIIYKAIGSKICYAWGLDDLWEKFTQYVGLIFGVEQQFNLKRIEFIKYLIGALRDTYMTVKLKPYLSFNKFPTGDKEFNLDSMINELQPLPTSWFGTPKFGKEPFGKEWNDEPDFTEVAVIMDKIKTYPWGHLHELIISDNAESSIGFQLWGVYFNYLVDAAAKHIPHMVMPW